MTNCIIRISLISILLSSPFIVYGAEDNIQYSCAELGYTTPYEDCIAVKGAVPLLCPFYSLNNEQGEAVENKMTVCMIKSCRGYYLTATELEKHNASDEQKLIAHVKGGKNATKGEDDIIEAEGLDHCTVGSGNEKLTYYKILECEEGSLYQDEICDVGCDIKRYPYTQHPGDLAGDVVECIDATGHRYGYTDCNDGWTGGWNSTKHDQKNATGRCDFASCDVKDYPYSRDPNSKYSENDVNRGATSTCKIGANNYYRYTAVDKNGATLNENVCGRGEHSAYTLSMGACRGQCVFENCTSTIKTENLDGYEFSYNEFICTQATKDCRVGDMAVFENVEAGIIVHLPENSSDRLLIMHTQVQSGKWAEGEKRYSNTPLPDGDSAIEYGKYASNFLLQYKVIKNTGLEYEQYIYPAFEYVNEFAPSGCEYIPVCKKGEWYIPAIKEYKKIYNNRYIISNAMDNINLIKSKLLSVNESNEIYGRLFCLNADGYNGLFKSSGKDIKNNYYPMLSFYVR